MKLEEELEFLTNKSNPSGFERNLITHLHDRCNRLWRKVSAPDRPSPDTIKFWER